MWFLPASLFKNRKNAVWYGFLLVLGILFIPNDPMILGLARLRKAQPSTPTPFPRDEVIQNHPGQGWFRWIEYVRFNIDSMYYII